jgi:uncharacterized membrane protein YagU involved in acid resistance
MLLAGLAGGLLGAFTTNLYAGAVSRITRGREARGAAPGSARSGRGMQPPQALHRADRDAAVQVGEIAYEAITFRAPPASAELRLGTAAHYAFSVSAGLAYGILAPRYPTLRSGFGVLYGTLVWAIADEGIVPLLGLSRKPRELSVGIHLYSLIGHALFGATLEGARRLSDPRHP